LRSRRDERRRASIEDREAAAHGGVATWAASFAHYLEPTAVVAGFTCVVYAVSLWRRVRT